jgi:Type II secretion system (T2SS), protein N
MKGKRWIALGAAALAIGGIAFVPARIIEAPANARLAAKFGNAINVAQITGTIWSGQGQLNIGTTGRPANVPISWQFAPRALVKLRLAFDVVAQSDRLSGTATAGIGFRTIEMSQVNISADATLVSAFNNLASLAGPRGVLRLTQPADERVTFAWWGGPSMNGALHAKAENLAVATLFPRPVGTYDLNITFRETLAEFAFTDTSGILKFDGSGQVRFAPQREFQFRGHAMPSRDVPMLLAALLPLGRPTLDGRVLIDYKTGW